MYYAWEKRSTVTENAEPPNDFVVNSLLKNEIKSRLSRGQRKFSVNKLCELIPDVLVIPKQGMHDSILISSNLSMESLQQLVSEHDDEEDIKIPSYNTNEMLHMDHVALYLRRLILDHKTNKMATLN